MLLLDRIKFSYTLKEEDQFVYIYSTLIRDILYKGYLLITGNKVGT